MSKEDFDQALTELAKAALPEAVSAFLEPALTFCSVLRRQHFYRQLLAEIARETKTGVDSPATDQALSGLLKSDQGKETVFDAYRRVCLSASRELSPKIIAILCARLLLEGRLAKEHEERMLSAAETLGDTELRAFTKLYWKHSGGTRGSVPAEFQRIVLQREQTTAPSEGGATAKLPPLSLWMQKLANLGILQITVQLEGHPRPGAEHTKYLREVSCNYRYQAFAELIDRATGPSTDGENSE